MIIEKEAIISSALSSNGEFLILNTSQIQPEIHLWRLSDFKLLNIYTGHKQCKFVVNCKFLNDHVILSGSEDGCLYYWHINQNSPVKIINISSYTLNDISIGFNKNLDKTLIATASDDSEVKILE